MVIRSIKMKNFRVFAEASLDDLEKSNYIGGPNRQGKSTIADALAMALTDAPDTAFNMLSAEWRYREAFELAERVRANDETGAAVRVKLEARVARLLKALADS